MSVLAFSQHNLTLFVFLREGNGLLQVTVTYIYQIIPLDSRYKTALIYISSSILFVRALSGMLLTEGSSLWFLRHFNKQF